MISQGELVPDLFKKEYKKIVSVLVRHFGLAQIEIAEDIASETFLIASETWGLKGIPANPNAWLYAVAKNKAKDYVKRSATFQATVLPAATYAQLVSEELDLSQQNIEDSQLRMIFALCHPALPVESQIALALRILCGLGIDEIANAFLTTKETINKRLLRGKEKLREENISVELPDGVDLLARIDGVLSTLYLLFNEGYYAAAAAYAIRKELCLESMRLTLCLLAFEKTNLPQVNALMALMCFHASRFDARLDDAGSIILYDQQDRTRWDMDLIMRGAYYLNTSARGAALHQYHLEAAIAFWHTKPDEAEGKWQQILQLYNHLLQVHYSVSAALNRTYALYRADGFEAAIREAEKLPKIESEFYYLLFAEIYREQGPEMALSYLQKALGVARTPKEVEMIKKKIAELSRPA